MRILGYTLLAIAGLGPLVDPGAHLTPRVEGWVFAYLLFGLAFHFGAAAGQRRRALRLSSLVVQTSALLAMAWLLPCQVAALTLVVAASQAALMLPLRTAVAWMALQTAGVAFFLVPSCHLKEGLASVAALAGFQGFAAVAVYLARREADARADLSHANAELVATRSLLDEASRAHERTRIARELHDVLGHDLTALGLQLEIATHVGAEAGRTHLTKAQEVNARLLRNVRDVVGAMSSEPGPDVSAALRAMLGVVPGSPSTSTCRRGSWWTTRPAPSASSGACRRSPPTRSATRAPRTCGSASRARADTSRWTRATMGAAPTACAPVGGSAG
jgi:signal transduction histidine kinase